MWRSHNLADPPIPNLYSPHSFLGMAAVTLLGIQVRRAAAASCGLENAEPEPQPSSILGALWLAERFLSGSLHQSRQCSCTQPAVHFWIFGVPVAQG